MIHVAWAYCFFSTQFRENLQIACKLNPDDKNLEKLASEECQTDNLSPYPGVVAPGERIDHDEFMRRLLKLSKISKERQAELIHMGERYLHEIRNIDEQARALSISSYEDGGLESVFKGILKARDYDNPTLKAFRFFITEHIRFDSDPTEGHGSLSRHMRPDDRILPLWLAFKRILIEAAPRLMQDDGEEKDEPVMEAHKDHSHLARSNPGMSLGDPSSF